MSLSPEVFGVLSSVTTVLVFVPYIRSVVKGQTRPHLYTWLLWGLMSLTAFVIQAMAGAGPGAWSTGLTGAGATIVAFLCLRHGEKSITRSDKFALACGLLALPLWIATRNPDASAVLVTLIIAFAYYPTFRKSWLKPHQELARAHWLNFVKQVLSLFALKTISIATTLFPVALTILNFSLAAMILWRRRGAA